MNGSDRVGRQILEILRSPTSELNPAWYDTAQVVRTWLRHPERVPEVVAAPGLDRLLRAQHPDGSWGYPQAPREYRAVPTLAAAAALLTAGEVSSTASQAADAALVFLTHLPQRMAPQALPDTIAVELIVPALLETIEEQLAPTHFARNVIRAALRLHEEGLATLRRLREAALARATLPPSARHSLEVLTLPPAGYRHTDYLLDGCLACSPAATAAALSWDGGPCRAAVDYLSAEGIRLGGAWPTVAPVRTFEAAWLIGAASRVGMTLPTDVAGQVGPWLAAQLSEDGCAAGPALAPDSDDTAIVLFALNALGHRWSPHHLQSYEEDTYFATFPGERTVSCSTNAHVLEVLLAAQENGYRDDYVRRGITKAAAYLLDIQHADGHWDDKWHASPLYATACSVLALQAAREPETTESIDRAIRWVLAQQRSDGSWGCWSGTREETAHALHILLGTEHRDSVAKGIEFLSTAPSVETPLWHGKELYEPKRIVDTLVLITLDADSARELPTALR